MDCYNEFTAFYGDIHNHCNISYGHGSMEAAFKNAKEQLDFCSVTGHADWPDMAESNPRIAHIIDFHKKGFSRLRERWENAKQLTKEMNEENEFVTFPGYEIHSTRYGDYTILYNDFKGDIISGKDIPDLKKQLVELRKEGIDTLAFPHHIGYLKGFRGMNWDVLTEDFTPVIEIISMHGCSETSDSARPFVFVLGPSDWESTMQYGLSQGKIFGVIGNTDHHSAHPGSYGHGRTGIWAKNLTQEKIWHAIYARRTYALTGDNIELAFAINDAPMGSIISFNKSKIISCSVIGGGIIDYVDVLKNNKVICRFSQNDIYIKEADSNGTICTKIFLEVGWGRRNKEINWNVDLGISDGRILSVEPRFKGMEVLSPLDKIDSDTKYYFSHWDQIDEKQVNFTTLTYGNPNTQTNNTQGMCLEVEMPRNGKVLLTINQNKIEIPLERILAGAKVGYLTNEQLSSPAWRLNQAPETDEYKWKFEFEDFDNNNAEQSNYYVRVKQNNNQWAWSSPIYIEAPYLVLKKPV